MKKENIQYITVLQLQKLLQENEIKGGTFMGLITDTEEKNIAKPKACELDGTRKIVMTVAQAFAHAQYVNKMKKLDANYEPKPRTWGVRMENSPLIDHNGVFYLEVFFNDNVKTKVLGYYRNGVQLDKEHVRANMREKKEEMVCYRNYALTSILQIKMNKVRYMIIANR
jgi:hypothetical protein